jgi:hypothetical protein
MGLRCFHVYYYDTDDNVLDFGRNSYALEIFNLKINVNKISHNKFLPKSMYIFSHTIFEHDLVLKICI